MPQSYDTAMISIRKASTGSRARILASHWVALYSKVVAFGRRSLTGGSGLLGGGAGGFIVPAHFAFTLCFLVCGDAEGDD